MNILIAASGNISRLETSLLASALNKNHKVTIASMARDAGHQALAFSTSGSPSRVEIFQYNEALRGKVKKVEDYNGIMVHEFYSRPADAVSIMLSEIMKHNPPDIVICGISNGTNLGPDIYSSSHVGMAIQATFLGSRAITIATEYNPGGNTEANLKPVIQFLESNLEELASLELPSKTFLNINVPRATKLKDLKGIRYTRMGKRGKKIEFDQNKTPKGQVYYWTRFASCEDDETKSDDRSAFMAGYVSISPINYDASNGGEI